MSSIHIYWDESHFWGLLLRRALEAWGVPHRLVRGTEIAQGALAGKSRPQALVVPGGRARGKADRLGPEGMNAVREYVRSGGTYIGFCGGTGLALTGTHGLGLSPWSRRGYRNRLHHFLSGHVQVDLAASSDLVPDELGDSALIPVWWPGRFAQADNDGVEVLARYNTPGPDFWVADLNLRTLPKGTMADWEALYGIHINPDFLTGLPCVTGNSYGKGRVFLSYAHLETPASRDANRWLGHILSRVLGTEIGHEPVPAWVVASRPVRWQDPVLMAARKSLEDIIETGRNHFLLFWRNSWLLGWRRGIPGAGINSLYSLVCESLARLPNDSALEYWERTGPKFRVLMELLGSGLTGYLLAERLAMTVFHSSPEAVSPQALREQRRALFGLPPEPGGIHADLVSMLEELYWRLCTTV
ncbi:BPL-N domain-containing protein [Pseudodesulfovibrio tunisiensis]|uniref:BPL-N domain-containing protein n=1 Tax=Pseudodesulfovibrio tunisiensis TaxID=463192 RepID=UPI001FB26045|nr:BPL-N domain-containing protein [Pseudodesulfovibrio tunisiensis]